MRTAFSTRRQRLARRASARYHRAVTIQFKLTLLRCDRSDPLADFFDARASVARRGSSDETGFTIAGRDLNAFVAAARRIQRAPDATALLTGGWDVEKRFRLQISRAHSGEAFEARVSIVSDEAATDLQSRTETKFAASSDALSIFLTDIQHLVERRMLGDATLNGDADAHA